MDKPISVALQNVPESRAFVLLRSYWELAGGSVGECDSLSDAWGDFWP